VVAGSKPELKGWVLPSPAKFLNIQTSLTGIQAEVLQLCICAPLAAGLFFIIRKLLLGSEMGASLSSFFRQSGIWAIVGFMFFYRFAEAMVNKAVPLFLKDPLTGGGLAFDNSQIGLVKGTIGMIGIICGGIVGGILVSKIGLKKGFWSIAILMHLPITLYLIAAIAQPTSMVVISVIEFADQFGYGLGYAGYSVYLMRVAQRGNYPTAHYAIGTGIGGSIIAVAGILSGVLVVNFGYVATFGLALLFGIPGVLTLLFIPHDDETPAVTQ
jgi:PAT family beta-lactamase induction signal transducer AmpG